MSATTNPSMNEAIAQLEAATTAKKCWQCGCLHQTLDAIDRALPTGDRPPELGEAVAAARARLTVVRYDCIGCDPCHPAVAVNALNSANTGAAVELEPCAGDALEERAGWPPLPGAFVVKRFTAPVAICTLTDDTLARELAGAVGPEVAIVGACQTENLGLERLIANINANPNIRALILCGPDTRQAVGHLPGQSLLALAAGGIDGKGRIVGGKGKRPVLKNISGEAVDHFRRFVEVIDLIGTRETSAIVGASRTVASRCTGPAPAFAPDRVVTPLRGAIPDRMVPDKAGYFVLDLERSRKLLRLEHYSVDGVLDVVIEGASAAELYCPAIERQLLTRLDHAAYLGRELARAERALTTGEPYLQDAAPERRARSLTLAQPKPSSSCGCGPTCESES